MYHVMIAVDKGSFASVAQAAGMSDEIDWSDWNSAEARTCSECFGALDLVHHLRQISPESVFELCSEVPQTGDTIVIGRLAEEVLDENLTGLLREEFLIHTYKEEERTVTFLCGRTRTAVLYAITGYLHALGVRWFSPAEHGTHIPYKSGFRLPEMNMRQSPSFKTRACYSELLDDSSEEFLDWLMHNRVNFVYLENYHHTENLKKRGIQICRGGHPILYRYFAPDKPYPYSHSYKADPSKPSDPYPLSREAVPPDPDGTFTYYHAHPEWYGLIDGVRSRNLGIGKVNCFGDNFCTSNPDALSELCRNLVDSLIQGELSDTDYLNFWMLDDGVWCQCPQCQKIGNEAARLCLVVYELNRWIQTARRDGSLKRDITILFPAYLETLPVPDRPLPEDFDYERCIVTCFPIERCYVHHLDDTGCTETNHAIFKRISAWAPHPGGVYQGELFIGEYYNVSSFAASSVSFTEKLAHDIPLYYRMGARHMYYMHMTSKDWGTLTPTNGLFYSLLWDVNLNTEQYLEEFYSLYYRNSKAVMKEFYRLLEQGSANMKYIRNFQYLFEENGQYRHSLFGRLNQMEPKEEHVFPLKHMQYDTTINDPNGGISMTETMETYQTCKVLLEQARFYCRDETAAARLAEDTMRFEYTYLALQYMFHMARLAIFHAGNRKTLAQCEYQIAARFAGQLKELTKPTEGLLHFACYRDGLGATWAEEAFLNYTAVYGSHKLQIKQYKEER